jgi:hypothetical protein
MSHKAPLSPMDQFRPSSYVRVILAFSNNDLEAAIVSLNSGLYMTYAQIPYVKGSVYQSDQQGYLGVLWAADDPPVRLNKVSAVHHKSTYAELDDQGMPDQYLSKFLLPPIAKALPDSGMDLPIFRVSYAIITGALLLCICFHRNVMDGAGVTDLLNVWVTNTSSAGSAVSTKVLDDPMQRSALLKKALFSNGVPVSVPKLAGSIPSSPASKPGAGSGANSNARSMSTSPKTNITSSGLDTCHPRQAQTRQLVESSGTSYVGKARHREHIYIRSSADSSLSNPFTTPTKTNLAAAS